MKCSIRPRGARLVLLLSFLLGLACAYVPTTRMDYEPRATAGGPTSELSLAVKRLDEERPPRHWVSWPGRIWLTYVPLIPYLKMPYERLDESLLKARNEPKPWKGHEEHFTQKIAEAITDDLRHSALFEKVEFVEGSPEPGEFDLALHGELRSTEFDAYITSYMLGIAGVYFWLLPLPIGSNGATVELDLELRDLDGRVLWEDRVKASSSKLFWLYTPQSDVSGFSLEIHRYRDNDFGIDRHSLWAYHADALRKAMMEARKELRNVLPRIERRIASEEMGADGVVDSASETPDLVPYRSGR